MKFTLVEIETYFTIRFILCTDIEIWSVKNKEDMTKVPANKTIFNLEISSKPYFYILGNILSMWKQYDF